ncbi:MAG: hypothetical protein ACHRXM_33855 [Isosphaerales bacterium]
MTTIDQLVTAVRTATRHVDEVHVQPSRDRDVLEMQEDAVHAEWIAQDVLRDYLVAHYPDPGRGDPFAVVLADGSIVTYHAGDVVIVWPENVHRGN